MPERTIARVDRAGTVRLTTLVLARAAALAVGLAAATGPAAAAVQTGSPAAAAPDGDAARRLAATRLTGDIAIDGRLDERVWDAARAAGGFVQFQPDPGAAATERTDVRVLYDDAGLYVGMRLHDAAPDSIVARLARRDEHVFSDWAEVYIDSRSDRRTGFGFALNAAGVVRDYMLFDDDGRDDGWDAVWDGAARIDGRGWVAEFFIPYSQLRFSVPDGPDAAGEGAGRASPALVWGINFGRQIARRDEIAYWSPAPPDEGAFVSRFGRLDGLRDVPAPRAVELLPYTVGRLTRAPGDPADPFFSENDPFGSAGADLKLGLGSGLTLSATVNPDFGQVEADPSVVNLSAYETRFPERRPFFVEGADLFRIRGLDAFYSRRIGRAPQAGPPAEAVHADMPEAATILAAAKLSGKTDGGWSIGVLDAVTTEETVAYESPDAVRGTAPVEPTTNYAVARVARDFQDGRSTIGGIVTATSRRLDGERLDFLRSGAYLAGLDGRHRFGDGRYEVSGAFVGSHVTGGAEAIARTQTAAGRYFQRPGADHLAYDPSRTTLSGLWASARIGRIAGGSWRWSANAEYTGPGFEINDLGYLRTTDRMSQDAQLRYVDFDADNGLRRWSAAVRQYSGWTTGGERLDVNGTIQADAELDSGWGGSIWAMRHEGGIDPDALRGGPAVVLPGRYMGGVGFYSDRREAVNGRVNLYWETEDDTEGATLSLHTTLSVRPSTRLELSAGPMLSFSTNDWQYVARRTVDDGDHYVLGRVRQRTARLQLRMNYTFTPTLSLEIYGQPFIGSGEYSALRTLDEPLADDFDDRFRAYADDEIAVETGDGGGRVFRISPGGDAASSFTIAPDFNFKQFRSNAVLRWEYRPGSTVFLVWSQDRTGFAPDGSFRVGRDARRLFDVPARNVFLVKVSYWLGM